MSNKFQEAESYKNKLDNIDRDIRDINGLESNEIISPGLKNLWMCMNDKFAKKNLWWATRYGRAQKRIKELEAKLAERKVELEELGVSHENKKREGRNQQ